MEKACVVKIGVIQWFSQCVVFGSFPWVLDCFMDNVVVFRG